MVCFGSHEDLKRAIDKYQGKDINGRRIKLVDDSQLSGRRYVTFDLIFVLIEVVHVLCIFSAFLCCYVKHFSRSRTRSRSPRSRSRSPRSRSRSASGSHSRSRSPVANGNGRAHSRSRSYSRSRSADSRRSRSGSARD